MLHGHMERIAAGVLVARQSLESSDPRVGSARQGSGSGGTLSHTSSSNSSGFTALLGTFIPVAIYSGVCLLAFVYLRRKCPRVYRPRTLLTSLASHERSPPLPSGWFNWIKPFFLIPDSHVLRHSSLDGYLFLRYLKVLITICTFGCCITWPILLPLNATGGQGKSDLDSLTFGNILYTQRYYAHVVVGYVFFGFILYMLARECIFCLNIRQAYLLSPYYASRPSSRTVLFTSVPLAYSDEPSIRRVLGPSVTNVWLPRCSKDLDLLVKERDQIAARLETAEIQLITTADKARRNAFHSVAHAPPQVNGSNSDGNIESQTPPVRDAARAPQTVTKYGDTGPPPNLNGSVASQWIPHSSRPSHRPLENLFRRADTIKWSRFRIKELNKQIKKMRRQMLRSEIGNAVPVAFVEFESQFDAQIANQAVFHPQPFRMAQRLIGVRPYEVVWRSLRITWLEKVARRFMMQGLIVAMIVFWSIPAAVVGLLSNIEFLAGTVPFLSWLSDLPTPVIGVLTGLVPALALSMLMSIVPAILRICARFAGVPTLSKVELFTQHAYFAFQVVQVFLITTLTSAASAAIGSVIQDPASAPSLLSQNLPKASNFYLSYFIVQCLALSANRLLQISGLLRFYVFNKFARNPRKVTGSWHRLSTIHWGSIFPVFSNFAVIAISYACIAPIMLGFAAIGMFVVYHVYRYNLIFVYSSKINTDGLVYPRALLHTFTGLYIAQVCMVGLFILRTAFGPTILAILFLVFTILIHMSLNDAIGPLLHGLPTSLIVQDKYAPGRAKREDSGKDDDAESFVSFDETDDDTAPLEGTERSMDGSQRIIRLVTHFSLAKLLSSLQENEQANKALQQAKQWFSIARSESKSRPSLLAKWLPPSNYSDHAAVRAMVAECLQHENEGYEAQDRYVHPSMRPAPTLYIPKDEGGISQQEVAHSGQVVTIKDELATLGLRGRLKFDYDTIPAAVLLEKELS